MKVVFRADSSQIIGSGHVMRCMTLANHLREKGAEILFICRELPGNIISVVEKNGFKVFHLSHDSGVNQLGSYVSWLGASLEKELDEVGNCLAQIGEINWLIADHYSLDYHWENMLRKHAKHIMVIDDLANRKHDCDILLDQNYYLDMGKRYIDLVPPHCNLLLGPKYALLRKEFGEAREKAKVRDGCVKRILLFMGGADLSNETKKALDALNEIKFLGIVDVVVGTQNQHQEEIKNICEKNKYYNFYCQVDNMAELMLKADLAIGAGGSATWERCYLGLPSFVITLADNQEKLARDTHDFGAIVYVGNNTIKLNELVLKLKDNIYDHAKIRAMSEKSFALVDGLGVSRVGAYATI